MASSSQDPQVYHSLWLQRRSTRRAVRRAQWRSDWTPVGLLLLLLGLLLLLSVFLPSHEAVEKMKQAAQDERGGSQRLPVVGVLTEP
jgi:di/tricarboxylate transporter